ncbi:hypothetical protein LTR94_027094 [Friedmanniomyces endolithicus]|nr:hypothetical protein LTR94_027094 [Friedmanniomyces endolithicus]
MTKLLIVLSAADTWTRADGSKYQSGVWAEEFVVMDEKFVAAGCAVDIATPGGIPPTIDPHSMNPEVVGQASVNHFRAYLDRIADRLAKPLVLADVATADYDAIVIPGGHGPDDGSWPFAGRRMTSFSDEEEIELGTADNAPWLLAKTLRDMGAAYEKGPNWGPYVVTDGNLMTGQNPASSAPLADAVLAALHLGGQANEQPDLATA